MTEERGALEQARVTRDEDASLAGRDRLLRLQTEAGDVSERPGQASLTGRAVSVGAVLDHAKAGALREGEGRGHVADASVLVRDDDRPGAIGQPALRICDVDVSGILLDITEHGYESDVKHRQDGRQVRVGRRKHLVARLEIEREVRGVERRGARAGREGIRHAVEAGELVLEERDRTAWLRDRELAAPELVEHCSLLVGTDPRPSSVRRREVDLARTAEQSRPRPTGRGATRRRCADRRQEQHLARRPNARCVHSTAR
jgi:hypothetical protein